MIFLHHLSFWAKFCSFLLFSYLSVKSYNFEMFPEVLPLFSFFFVAFFGGCRLHHYELFSHRISQSLFLFIYLFCCIYVIFLSFFFENILCSGIWRFYSCCSPRPPPHLNPISALAVSVSILVWIVLRRNKWKRGRISWWSPHFFQPGCTSCLRGFSDFPHPPSAHDHIKTTSICCDRLVASIRKRDVALRGQVAFHVLTLSWLYIVIRSHRYYWNLIAT